MVVCFNLVVFILGLCCGSFVNMLVYRVVVDYGLEDKKFKVKNEKRSFCDYCGRQLKWYENIPVVSWLVQKGKTRCCDKKLPILYPIVEIVIGLLFLLFFWKGDFLTIFEMTGGIFEIKNLVILVVGLLIVVFLIFSAVFDLKYMILPDFSTIILVISGLILWFIRYFGDWSYLWSALISFLFLGFLYLVTKKKGMGLGDVKLALFMGLFLGKMVIMAFYVAFIAGAVVALVLVIFKKADRKTLVPFGPFLILGIVVTWFWGQELLGLSVYQFIR
jgi:prepilin signal peptidase PulO-like enzyme (type II secretory pathway)